MERFGHWGECNGATFWDLRFREGFARQLATLFTFVLTMVALYGISRVIGIFGESFSRLEYCKSHCTGIIGAIFAVDWSFCFIKATIGECNVIESSDGTNKASDFYLGFYAVRF